MEEKEVLESIVKVFIESLIDEVKRVFKGITAEAQNFIGKGLREYLEKQKDKYSYIKTILRGTTPVFLYDIYYPLKLKRDKISYETNSVRSLFKESNYLTIIGDAGSGKSTLVKHLFLNAIYDKYAIPILIELRYLNDYQDDIESYIKEKLFDYNLSTNDNILDKLLNNGKFLFFLDGFDEIISSSRTIIIKDLNSFITKYDNNKFILTSRPYSNIEHLPLFHNLWVQELSENEVYEFIDKQLPKEQELAEKIKGSIKTNKISYIKSFIKNPLLLSIYILTYQSNAQIPNKKYIFYRRVIQVLFSEHDSKTKLGYNREIISGLSQELFEEVLKRFCFLSYFENKINFDIEYINNKLQEIKYKVPKLQFENDKLIYDLKLSIALWLDDNGSLSFAHRSLQEYFAAYFIQSLNEENKKNVYDKIKLKSPNMAYGEMDNLISLLDEMDHLSYLKYYYMPLLNDFSLKMKTFKKEEAIMYLSNIFGEAILGNKEKIIKAKDNLTAPAYFEMNIEDLFLFDYSLNNFFINIYILMKNRIIDMVKNNDFDDIFSKNLVERKVSLSKNYAQIVTGETLKEMERILNSILEFTETELVKSNETLKNDVQSDKDLIAMI